MKSLTNPAEQCCTGNCAQGRLCPAQMPCEDSHRGLLASRYFWIGGALSVGCWSLVYFALKNFGGIVW